MVAIPDFRLFWLGAFVSFSGSWIQNVAQGYYVFRLTGDETKLATIALASSLPAALLGLFVGGFADVLDKRRTLIVCQALFGAVALGLAWATWAGYATYGLLLGASVVNGFVSTIENTTRQSVVSRVVPRELLAAAVPASATTFNLARILGPAIGGIMLTQFGVPVCYAVNGLSFLALIFAVRAIRSDLSGIPADRTPWRELMTDGLRFTFAHARLRALLIMETATACFGVFYVSLIPSYVERTLGATPAQAAAMNGHAYSAIGLGALGGLFLATTIETDRARIRLVAGAMAMLALALVGLSSVRTELASWPFLALAGACSVIQFNTTNGLFQTLAPDERRGRVVSIHIWALNGLSPFGTLAMSWVAVRFVTESGGGVPVAMRLGAALVLAFAAFGAAALRREHYVRTGERPRGPGEPSEP